MKIAKVIGNVVAEKKEGNVRSLKILVVRYLDENLKETGKTAACIDSIGAGAGDFVLLCSSSSARLTKVTNKVCTDNTIIAIIDTVSAGYKDIYSKSKEGK